MFSHLSAFSHMITSGRSACQIHPLAWWGTNR